MTHASPLVEARGARVPPAKTGATTSATSTTTTTTSACTRGPDAASRNAPGTPSRSSGLTGAIHDVAKVSPSMGQQHRISPTRGK
eukprot:133074-Pyramimonas_sp.AAC.1